ncbi:MAG: indole-3-glycerol phosphate synthase TrpC [Candidatus Cloacimonetes bacterium]|nr:indole-3-glycerol phosphate synthase TrpC [Candidatus Cloacimonadota bacterium]
MNILEEIVQHKKQEIEKLKAITSLDQLKKQKRRAPLYDFEAALKQDQIQVIAEIKRRSPSEGDLYKEMDCVDIAQQYEKSGAAAISVLTDKKYFNGQLDDLKLIKSKVDIPILRKDFIVSDYQIYESYVSGADAILLIADAISMDDLSSFHSLAKNLGLGVLIETHQKQYIRKISTLNPSVFGINCRDLRKMETNLKWFEEVIDSMPNCVRVAESGIHSIEDLKYVKDLNFQAALIGTAFMKNHTPGETLSNFLCGARA